MELEDCAFPLLRRMVRTSSADEAFVGVNWALLVGAVPRKAGMERKDLLTINGGIFSAQGKAIAAQCGVGRPDAGGGQPVQHELPDRGRQRAEIPADRWFAMTMLDENRGRSQLAARAGVAVEAVTRSRDLGQPLLDPVPRLLPRANRWPAGVEVIDDEAWLQGEFISTVQQRGAAIIAARGQSSAASAANAVIDTVRNITQPSGEFFSSAIPAPADGGYGVPEGIVFGYPLRATATGIVEIEPGIVHNAWAQARVDATLAELVEEREAVMELVG